MIMSAYTIMRDDFRNVRRSYIVLGVIGVFASIVGLVFISEVNVYPDPYRTLFDVGALTALAFPLFVAPLTYLSIAGDVSSGAIKYTLGLPNSRLEYFVGKYVSRAAVAVAAVVLGTLVGFMVATTTFNNSADPIRFLEFAGASVAYALSISGIFVGISAMTASRSRAMFSVLAAYFVLVVFWAGFLPFLSLQTIIDAVVSTLSVTISDSTRNLIRGLSPVNAYFQTTTEVYTGVFNEYEAFSMTRSGSDRLVNRTWFNVLVMLGWATVVPLLGYLKFRMSELG
jgi:ABC-2 type transport system permease protein